MRATVQRVTKYVTETFHRSGVFGGPEKVNSPYLDSKGLPVPTDTVKKAAWDDVVLVMSPEEAEAILKVLQVVTHQNSSSWKERPGGSRVPDSAFMPPAGLPPSAMVRGLEMDLRKLTDSEGRVMFEPGPMTDDPTWRLSAPVRDAARRAEDPPAR